MGSISDDSAPSDEVVGMFFAVVYGSPGQADDNIRVRIDVRYHRHDIQAAPSNVFGVDAACEAFRRWLADVTRPP